MSTQAINAVNPFGVKQPPSEVSGARASIQSADKVASAPPSFTTSADGCLFANSQSSSESTGAMA